MNLSNWELMNIDRDVILNLDEEIIIHLFNKYCEINKNISKNEQEENFLKGYEHFFDASDLLLIK